MFFPIQHLIRDPTGDQVAARSESSDLDKAIDRMHNQSDHLTGDMRSCLTATLTVLHCDSPHLTGTGALTTRVLDPLTTPHHLLQMADQISHGLTAFLVKGGGNQPPVNHTLPTKTKSSRQSTKIRNACCARHNTTARFAAPATTAPAATSSPSPSPAPNPTISGPSSRSSSASPPPPTSKPPRWTQTLHARTT